MGSGNMDARLADLVADHFADAKQDLYACFVSRGPEILRPHGLLGIVVGDSWIALKTFEAFRETLLRAARFHSFLHLDDVSKHADSFGANTAFVCTKSSPSDQQCTFVELEPLRAEAKRVRLLEAVGSPNRPWVFRRTPTDFRSIPGSPFAYGLSDAVRSAFITSRPLMGEVELREGLTTGDNGKYLRYWWEVSAMRCAKSCNSRGEASASGARWFPHKKGGPFRRWYGNQDLVINWAIDGAEIEASVIAQYGGSYTKSIRSEKWYFKSALSWVVFRRRFLIRWYPAGQLFDSASPSVFAPESAMGAASGWCHAEADERRDDGRVDVVGQRLLAPCPARLGSAVGDLLAFEQYVPGRGDDAHAQERYGASAAS